MGRRFCLPPVNTVILNQVNMPYVAMPRSLTKFAVFGKVSLCPLISGILRTKPIRR
jgi:hypothetical protein